MKKTIVTLLLVSAATFAFAQDSTGHRHMKDRMKADLQLTEQQRTRLKDINRSFLNDAKAIRSDKSLSPAEKKTRMQELSNNRTGKMKEVLDADQFSKWQQRHSAMHDRAMAHKGRRHGKTGGDMRRKMEERTKTELGLSDAQSQQLQTLNSDFYSKLKNIRGNSALTNEERKEQLSRLKEEHDTKLKSALDAGQYEKYRQLRARREDRLRKMRKQEDRQLPGKTTPSQG